MNVVLVGYSAHQGVTGGGSWVAHTLTTWRKWWLSEKRWDPAAAQSKLTGFCSLDPEFYSPFLPDTVGSTKMKKRRHPPPPPPPRLSVEETLARLRAKVGHHAVRRLRLGKATLQLWRGSSPWNVWVEGSRGAQLWHSSDDDRGPGFDAFELLTESNDRIAHSAIHRDGGHPYHSVYVLKPQYRL